MITAKLQDIATNKETTDLKYIINDKDKVVVCILYCNIWETYNRILKYYPDYNLSDLVRHMQDYNYYVGVAKCAPEDDFDIEYGKKLALTRAKIKRSKAMNREVIRVINKLKKSTELLEKYAIHHVPVN